MHIRGVISVVQVPYEPDFSIDYATLEKEIGWLFDCGVNGLAFGMVSEFFRMTEAERDRVVAQTVRFAAGRGPVVATAGGESIQQALRHGLAAQEAGASALMVTPPATTAVSGEEVFEYYVQLLNGTQVPIIVQDASGYMGRPIPIPVQAKLFQLNPQRILFKPEAPPLGANLSALRDATGGKAAIFEGTGGSALLNSFRRGIAGTMPGCEMPWAFSALWKALEAGDWATASILHAPIAPLIALCHNLDAFLAMEKTLLVRQGIFKNSLVRGPLGFKLDPETEAEMVRLFDEIKRLCDERHIFRGNK